MIETLTFTLHILLWPLCVVIVGLILLQGGAGDISSAFGGGGQLDSTLGVGAGRKMAKLTGWLAAIFMATVVFLAIPHKGLASSGSTPSTAPSTSATGIVPKDKPAVMSTGDGKKPPVEGSSEAKVVETDPEHSSLPAVVPNDAQPVEAAKPVAPPAPDAAKPPEANKPPDAVQAPTEPAPAPAPAK
ncbi:MAG: preprotein translocase subunit SecG [Planctomycetes bacterium]|nr:preprotein translocase subunit SecG [Planctomycetota bacterium]